MSDNNIGSMLRGFKKIDKSFYEKKYNIKIELHKNYCTVIDECEDGMMCITIHNYKPYTFNHQLYEREMKSFFNFLF